MKGQSMSKLIGTPQKQAGKRELIASEDRTPWAKRLSVWITVVCAVVAVALGAFVYVLFFYDGIYPNVYVGGTPVGGMSITHVQQLVEENASKEFSGKYINVNLHGYSLSVDAQKAGGAIDVGGTVELAHQYGRTGNLIKRTSDVLSSLWQRHDVNVEFLEDGGYLAEQIAQAAAAVDKDMTDCSYSIGENEISVKLGISGLYIDQVKLKEQIISKLQSLDFSAMEFKGDVRMPAPIDLQSIYDQVYVAPQDAKLDTAHGNKTSIVAHVTGRSFDLEKARQMLEGREGVEVVIPIISTEPEVTYDMLEKSLFRDVLSEKTTYLTNLANRTQNVRLAAGFVNGTILNPGDIFSYNEVVGPRTLERGFQVAKVFSKGEIVDDIGGGICQVSSTIYQTVLYSDLKVVERRNHSFIVDYVPLGQDATVFYGSVDFKFQNDTDYPIKVLCVQKKNYLTVTLLGTKTDEKTVKLSTVNYNKVPYEKTIEEDPAMAPGTKKVTTPGHTGWTTEVTRIVYDANGNEIRRSFESKSVYKKLDEVTSVGPGVITTPPPTSPSPPPSAPPSTPPSTPPTDNPETSPSPSPELSPSPTPSDAPPDSIPV